MVIWSEPARNDLKNIHEYIAQDSSFYAQQVSISIIEKTETLVDFPDIGRVVPEIDDSKMREVFVHSYRIIYEIDSENIVIHAIIHGKRDFNQAFDHKK